MMLTQEIFCSFLYLPLGGAQFPVVLEKNGKKPERHKEIVTAGNRKHHIEDEGEDVEVISLECFVKTNYTVRAYP